MKLIQRQRRTSKNLASTLRVIVSIVRWSDRSGYQQVYLVGNDQEYQQALKDAQADQDRYIHVIQMSQPNRTIVFQQIEEIPSVVTYRKKGRKE